MIIELLETVFKWVFCYALTLGWMAVANASSQASPFPTGCVILVPAVPMVVLLRLSLAVLRLCCLGSCHSLLPSYDSCLLWPPPSSSLFFLLRS